MSRGFNPKEWINKKCTLFNEYMKNCGLKAAVYVWLIMFVIRVSISGGVDSACVTALVKYAMQMPDSPIKKILAVAQPISSSQWAFDRAKECCDALGVEMVTIDQTKIYNDLLTLVDDAVKIKGNTFNTGQLRSYMRTPVAYYVAQLLSQENPCIVMGTGNRDEDGYLGYFCKAGDGVVDIQLIADLHKSEVFKVSKELKVPDSIVNAPPSADLWDGQTDENEMGITYDFVELYTGYYLNLSEDEKSEFIKNLSKEALVEFQDSENKAVSIHKRNAHKLSPGPKIISCL